MTRPPSWPQSGAILGPASNAEADLPSPIHSKVAGPDAPAAGGAGLDAKGRLETLRWMLDHSDALVRYAEAKNGLLTALAGGSVAAIMRVTLEGGWLTEAARDAATLLLGLNMAVCLISFVPRLAPRVVGLVLGDAQAARRRDPASMPMYFEHAARMDEAAFAAAMAATAGLDPAALSRIERAVLEQVRQTSIVARAKFAFFSVGVWLFLAGVLCLLTALLTRA